jgi:hypothetical protein
MVVSGSDIESVAALYFCCLGGGVLNVVVVLKFLFGGHGCFPLLLLLVGDDAGLAGADEGVDSRVGVTLVPANGDVVLAPIVNPLVMLL